MNIRMMIKGRGWSIVAAISSYRWTVIYRIPTNKLISLIRRVYS